MARTAETLSLDDQFDPDQIQTINAIVREIEGGHPYGVRKAMEDHSIPETALHGHIVGIALRQLEHTRYNPVWIKGVLDHFHVPITREILTAAAKAVVGIAQRGDINQARAALDAFDHLTIPSIWFTHNDFDIITHLNHLIEMDRFDDARFYAGILGIPHKFMIAAGKKAITGEIATSIASYKQKLQSIETISVRCGLTIQDVREAAEQGIRGLIYLGKIKEARRFQKHYGMSDKKFKEETKKVVNQNLNEYEYIGGAAERAGKIQKAAPTEVTPALRRKARRVLLSELRGNDLATAVSFQEAFKIPINDEIKEAATENINVKLAGIEIEATPNDDEKFLPTLAKAIKTFKLLSRAEIKEKIIDAATKGLKNNRMSPKFIKDLLEKFGITQEESKKLAIDYIETTGIVRQRDIEIIIVFEIQKDEAIQKLVSEELQNRLGEKEDPYGAIDLIEKLNLKLTQRDKATGRRIILEELSQGRVDKRLLEKAAEFFDLNPEDQRIVTATSQGVVTALRMAHESDIARLLDTGSVDITRSSVKKAALDAIRKCRRHNDFQTARDLMKRFGIDRSKVLSKAA